MILNTTDINDLLEHIHNTVDFYDRKGAFANTSVITEIRDALRSYVGTPSSRSAERFELVKIAFDRQLRAQLPNIPDFAAFGRQVVELADAVLAAMAIEKDENPETEQPDTGPSAAESTAMLTAIQTELQGYSDKMKRHWAEFPTENAYSLGYRVGHARCLEVVFAAISNAMEKPGEAVSPAHENRPTCSEEDGGL